jgi:two-component system catabolic regulation response regulator CreB
METFLPVLHLEDNPADAEPIRRATPMKPLILIVEDEPAITDNIRYALETEGFDTVAHAEGQPAAAFIKQSQIQPPEVSLVILDIGLPDISGLELCKRIRAFSQVPIIFLTARSDEIDRVVGLEIGADDYVVKPFSPRELTARVKAVLRRGRLAETPPPPAAFQVDPDKRQISYHGRPLTLSRYEYDILKTFIRLPGHVFTRERLMEAVWEEPEVSMDRTVDAHIKNIRAKLKQIRPHSDPIVTHRGVGYSLKEEL